MICICVCALPRVQLVCPRCQRQLAGMVIDPEEFVQGLPPAVRARVEALQVTGDSRRNHWLLLQEVGRKQQLKAFQSLHTVTLAAASLLATAAARVSTDLCSKLCYWCLGMQPDCRCTSPSWGPGIHLSAGSGVLVHLDTSKPCGQANFSKTAAAACSSTRTDCCPVFGLIRLQRCILRCTWARSHVILCLLW